MVLDALRILDKSIERLAWVGSPRKVYRPFARGGMVVKCTGIEPRIPIGSLGDGIWRVLGLALSLVRSRGSILLVDEIDTGLHHTVMSDTWRMLVETSERLEVQVFATTHSQDCVSALASVCGHLRPGQVSLQRIEPSVGRAVAFSQEEIRIAAERDIEIR